VAGKTGTAQWGPISKRRNAAWFTGYAPADQPLYAFAAVVEGNPGESLAGGQNAAPVIGAVLSDLLKDYKPQAEKPADSELVAEETSSGEQPSAEDNEAAVTEESPSEFTQDLMNPEGTPLILETGLPE